MATTKDYFDRWSDSYGQTWQKDKYPIFLQWIFDTLLQVLPKKKKATILDLGTGGGRVILILRNKFKDAHFIGLDISDRLLDKARKETLKNNIDAEFIKSRMSSLHLADSSVDFVVSNFAIHHCRSKKKMADEVYRVLKPEGYFAFGDIHKKFDDIHIKEVGKLRKKYPELAKRFDKSREDTWNSLSEKEKREHPREYHIGPSGYLRILKNAGFKKAEIIRSVNKEIAVIKAQKPA